MKKCLIFLIAAFIFSSNVVFSQTSEDTQFWNETTVEFPINRKISGIVIGNLRVTDDISDLSDKRIGFAVKYKTKKN